MFITQTIPLQRPAIYTLPSDLWHDRQCQGLSIYCHRWYSALTHWGRVAHICVGKLTSIGSDNGLSPGRRQAIIWTNAGKLLIGHLGTNFNDILIGIQTFSFKKMHLKINVVCEMASILSRPHCVNSCRAEAGIFRDNQVNATASDALAPCVAKSSAAKAFGMSDRLLLSRTLIT